MATFKKAFFQGLWKLAKDYWQSEEKWKAYGLLIVVALLNFFGVYILILINDGTTVFIMLCRSIIKLLFGTWWQNFYC